MQHSYGHNQSLLMFPCLVLTLAVVDSNTVSALVFIGFGGFRRSFEEIASGAQARFLASDSLGFQVRSQASIRPYKPSKQRVCAGIAS
ncbi:MAG: isocitrate dehydrogenase kinase/phosphatase [Candidatus Azotimanducaceae bacterium]|jgi:isocitrate dehydrogenase kinase/phosphatase